MGEGGCRAALEWHLRCAAPSVLPLPPRPSRPSHTLHCIPPPAPPCALPPPPLRSLTSFSGGVVMPKEAILTVPCDVLIPAAIGGVIDETNARDLQCKVRWWWG